MDEQIQTDQQVGSLYDHDFYRWALDQGARLRHAADGGVAGLDWDNLAEEIESLARRDRRELASHIRTILEHLIKLQASPATDPRENWARSIRKARLEVRSILGDSPSLVRQTPGLIKKELSNARMEAVKALTAHRETPRTPIDLLDYTPEQALGDWWPDAPIDPE
jgi:hypothetical protein